MRALRCVFTEQLICNEKQQQMFNNTKIFRISIKFDLLTPDAIRIA